VSELAKLAIDFFVFTFYLLLATVGGSIILYAVGETVEHFTP
jgi:hypothetical protein